MKTISTLCKAALLGALLFVSGVVWGGNEKKIKLTFKNIPEATEGKVFLAYTLDGWKSTKDSIEIKNKAQEVEITIGEKDKAAYAIYVKQLATKYPRTKREYTDDEGNEKKLEYVFERDDKDNTLWIQGITGKISSSWDITMEEPIATTVDLAQTPGVQVETVPTDGKVLSGWWVVLKVKNVQEGEQLYFKEEGNTKQAFLYPALNRVYTMKNNGKKFSSVYIPKEKRLHTFKVFAMPSSKGGETFILPSPFEDDEPEIELSSPHLTGLYNIYYFFTKLNEGVKLLGGKLYMKNEGETERATINFAPEATPGEKTPDGKLESPYLYYGRKDGTLFFSVLVVSSKNPKFEKLEEIGMQFRYKGDKLRNDIDEHLAGTDVVPEHTAVEENAFAEVSVYPNPFAGQLMVKDVAEATRVMLVNLQGAVLRSVSVNGANELVLDVEDVPAGLYMLVVENGSARRTIKVVK